MTRKYRRPLAALVLALAVVATATLGSAATLTVNAASIATFTVTHPCTGNATAIPSAPIGSQFTGVTVTLPSAYCNGRLVQVTVLDGTTVLRQAQATASGATATITGLVAYTAQSGYSVKATVGGWNLPTTWTYSVIPAISCTTDVADRPCAASITSNTAVSGGYNLLIRVADTRTGNSNNPAIWAVQLNFAAPEFTALPKAISSTDPVQVTSTCGALPLVTVVGTSSGSFNQLRLGTVRTFTLQVRTSGTGTLLTCA